MRLRGDELGRSIEVADLDRRVEEDEADAPLSHRGSADLHHPLPGERLLLREGPALTPELLLARREASLGLDRAGEGVLVLSRLEAAPPLLHPLLDPVVGVDDLEQDPAPGCPLDLAEDIDGVVPQVLEAGRDPLG